MTDTIYTGVTLIDGTGSPARTGIAIRVSEGTIQHVGRSSDLEAAGAEVVDLSGRTVLPGLVNAHEHFSMKGFEGKYYDQHRQEAQMQLLRAAQGAYRSLADGITTARDCGAHGMVNVTLRDGIASGVARGPRVVTCGQVIQPAFEAEGVRPVGMTREAVDAADVRRLAHELIDEGVDFLKVKPFRSSFTDGSRRTFTTDEISPAVEVAHDSGRRIASHAWYPEDLARSLEAGVDAIEHGLYCADALDLIDEVARRGLPFVPCWRSWTVSQHGTPERSEHHRTVIKRAIAGGALLAVGTDLYAEGMVDEMIALAEMGLGPLGAISAATGSGAKACGLDDVGTIEAGKRADLLVLDGDPLADLGALRSPMMVIAGGERLGGGPASRPTAQRQPA